MDKPSPPLIDRAFVRVSEGLVHYRSVGDIKSTAHLPLYMAHAGPGSGRSMGALMQAMGPDRFIMAPDMLGNGDSDPPASENGDIGYYADCVMRVMDALGLEQIDFYGSHTGALIGMEVSLRDKSRIRKLVLDGLLIFSDEEKRDLLANYAPKMVPDDHGGYLSWCYQFIRDMGLFWPHYRRESATSTGNGVPPAEQIYMSVVDVLKALKTYHIAYRAAFSYNVEAALAKLEVPAFMTCSSWDPMHVYLEQSAAMAPGAKAYLFPATTSPSEKAAIVKTFLDQ